MSAITFRDILAGRDDAEFRIDIGDGAFVSACCATDDESVMDCPAMFDVMASWGQDGVVGRYDNLHGELDPHLDKLAEMIAAEFGGTWHYSAVDSAIVQARG